MKLKKSLPTCKICKREGHYAYQCWQKPKKIKINRIPIKQKSTTDKAKLIAKLDRVFSLYVRKYYSSFGRVQCYTCGKIERIEDIQCGHYIKRRFLNTRFDFENAKPQCKTCNETLGGNYEVYKHRLIGDYGPEFVDNLFYKAHSNHKMSIVELEFLYDYYKKRI